ncbi:MAG: cysteine--tRNA ligase [Candidatus Thermoplasmatota archaeon]|nr:cysteine--tRNA ligase [Candidatus Thermoplasmatota archaeon]
MKVYDTMSREKVPFTPQKDREVRMYVCGLTVYDEMHVGHAKSFVSFDFISRYLRYSGYAVKLVINITDVDDKIIKRANEAGISPLQLSSFYSSSFLRDIDGLLIERATFYPRASQHIPEIIDMIASLMEKGYAYEIDGSVYFDITKTRNYGRLSGQSPDMIMSGARIEVDERKRNPADFALWKSAREGEISWESPWGRGRPGWHIECSAMSMKYLGQTLDIHGGGEDLIFPHHENEIQQSEAYTGKRFSNYWIHVGLLNLSGQKMSKSLNNFVTVSELLKRYCPQTLRLYFANSLYRRQSEFSFELLDESDQARRKLENYMSDLLSVQTETGGGEDIASSILSSFAEYMDDDFNTHGVISLLFTKLREARRRMEEGTLSLKGASSIVSAVREINSVLLIMKDESFTQLSGSVDSEVAELIERREEARKSRRFEEADAIRKRLRDMGIVLEDTPEGVRWKRIERSSG